VIVCGVSYSTYISIFQGWIINSMRKKRARKWGVDLLLLLRLLSSFCYMYKKNFSANLVVLSLTLWFLERLVWYPNRGVSQGCRPHLAIGLDYISLNDFCFYLLLHTTNGKCKFSLDHTTLLCWFLKYLDVFFPALLFPISAYCSLPTAIKLVETF
jgi:hypothetical protein